MRYASPDYKEIVAFSASITTVLQFFSGCFICKKYMRNGSTGEASSMPFVAGAASCVLWLMYGILLKDRTIVLLNTIGSSLFIFYIVIFYIYSSHKSIVLRQVIMVTTTIGIIQWYGNFESDSELLKIRLGFFASFISVSFCAAPLANLIHSLRIGNTDSLPVPMISMAFATSIQWFIYGIIIQDSFIQYSNAAAAIFTGFQLTVFMMYSKSSLTPKYGKLTLIL